MTKNELIKSLLERDIPASEESVNKLIEYRDYLLQKNESINLTSIVNPDEFLEKMTFDSALILSLVDFSNKKILDVGTGGGFPGTVISTLTNQEVFLLDSTKKKLNVIDEFNNPNFHTICARAEDYIKDNRESFDIVVARAVSQLNILLELCIPFLKVGGYFIAQKGIGYENEINESSSAFKKLNCHIVKIAEDGLPNGNPRYNILIKKDAATPTKFPREYAEIKQKPLK